MIDINLLNKKGLYDKSNKNDFNHIDENLDKAADDNIKSSSGLILDDDFESTYSNQNSSSDNFKFKKMSGLLIVVLAGLAIFTYYQFFKLDLYQVPSSSIKEFIFYVLDNENVTVKNITVDGNSIDMNFDISKDSFDTYKSKIGKYLDKMGGSSQFEYMLSEGSLSIKSSNGLDIVNGNFDNSSDIQNFLSGQKIGVSSDELKGLLDSVFNINNEGLIGFDITPTDLSYYYYDISFPK